MHFVATDALMGLLGGLLIGGSAALMLLLNGRIAGISGITGGVLTLQVTPRWRENALFLVGLIAAPLFYAGVAAAPAIGLTGNVALVAIGGLLVGFGTRLGNGCTSGHGVCGMSRLSRRSFAATGIFMIVAVLVATVVRPLVGA